MSATQHTPGPWQIETFDDVPHSRIHAKGEIGGAIADIYGNGDHGANARLIAAAPDLLAALREVDEAGRAKYASDFGAAEALQRVAKTARAAISKATEKP